MGKLARNECLNADGFGFGVGKRQHYYLNWNLPSTCAGVASCNSYKDLTNCDGEFKL